MKNRFTSLNLPVVLTVATLCGIAMVLFFIRHGREMSAAEVEVADTIVEEPFDEIAYYHQLADEYDMLIPSDKRVVARLIDSVNHQIVYFESGSRPSCYSYDLESQTTSVIFGGSNGFYVGTQLLMLGSIDSWQRVGNRIVFIAENNAPEAEYPSAYEVFSIDLYTHSMEFIDRGAAAYFPDSNHVTIVSAQLIYRKLFSDEPVYNETSYTRSL